MGLDGPNGVLARERVSDLKRARNLTAITELTRERGVRGVTVVHIVARSGVSRRTFYDLFEDCEDCLRAAFEHAVGRAAETVLADYEAASGWHERIAAGLEAALGFLDAEPAMGALCVVDALAAEGAVAKRRARVVELLVDAVHEGGGAKAAAARGAKPSGRSLARDSVGRGSPRRPPRIVAEGAVGAVLAVIHARMVAADAKPLGGLLGPLASMIVLPYLGPAAAERELARRPARRRARATPARPDGDPLRELDIRLTYRTVRVLLAVSELGGRGSGPSGRQVADAAGVADPARCQSSCGAWRISA